MNFPNLDALAALPQPQAPYEIHNANNGEVLAHGLSEEQLAQWWSDNEDSYSSLRIINGCIIEVVDV